MEFRETSDAKEVEEVGNKDNTDECKLDEKKQKKLDKLMGDDELPEKQDFDKAESFDERKSLKEKESNGFDHLMGDDELECGEQEGESEKNPEEKSSDVNEKKDGLTDEQKKEVKEKTGWSDEIIDFIGSMKEAEIYMNAGLVEAEVNGKKCLIRNDIDLDQKDEDGITNRERTERGRPPITKNGEEVELHHIGQKPDSPLAELTMEQHRGTGNDTILHDKSKESEIDRNEFGKERRDHWKDRANIMEGVN